VDNDADSSLFLSSFSYDAESDVARHPRLGAGPRSPRDPCVFSCRTTESIFWNGNRRTFVGMFQEAVFTGMSLGWRHGRGQVNHHFGLNRETGSYTFPTRPVAFSRGIVMLGRSGSRIDFVCRSRFLASRQIVHRLVVRLRASPSVCRFPVECRKGFDRLAVRFRVARHEGTVSNFQGIQGRSTSHRHASGVDVDGPVNHSAAGHGGVSNRRPLRASPR